MGQPKLALPWENDVAIIAYMVETFRDAPVDPIVVVTGANRPAIEDCLEGYPATLVHNPEHVESGMIGSIRIGLKVVQESACDAVLISPGDLPSVHTETLRKLIEAFGKTDAEIVAPSYDGRRGHPVLVSRGQWAAILDLPQGKTMRDFLRMKSDKIRHVVVSDAGILRDVDSPQDYERSRRGSDQA
jgi:CTP:molybdopterin cytidylyltransferase MocA